MPDCPACGLPARKRAAAVLLTASGALITAGVCPDCVGRSVRIVASEKNVGPVLAPFARYLRQIAKAYELNDDGRHVGLSQAADILESGKVPALREDLERGRARPGVVVFQDALRAAFRGQASVTVVGAEAGGGKVPEREDLDEALAREVVRQAPTAPAPPPEADAARCDRALLSALALRGKPTARAQLAILAGYSVRSGGFDKSLRNLRASGAIATGEDGAIEMTAAGRVSLTAAGGFAPLRTRGEVLIYWSERLGPCAGALLQVLASEAPQPVSREMLEELTGYRRTSGGFDKALRGLRRLFFAEKTASGHRASHALMDLLREEDERP